MIFSNVVPAYPAARRYRFATALFLERFDDEALLLVAGRDLLLTVNAAAADLFEAATGAFPGVDFSVREIAAWLFDNFQLPAALCIGKARDLLAFGLRHGLVQRAGAER